MEEKKDIFDFIEKRSVETPDSTYFNNLANQVIANTEGETPKISAKVVPFYRKPATWISAIAAAILIAFLILPEETIQTSGGIVDFNDLSKKEVLAYVDENINDFDEDLLAEFIPSNQLKSDPMSASSSEEYADPIETIVETETQNLQKSLESISKDEILEYLEDEGLDTDDLDDELFL